MGIIGLDEVGRGAWAGPLVFAAVSLNPEYKSVLNDSKKLTTRARAGLSKEIIDNSLWEFASIDSREIDEIGLTKASEKACRMLLEKLSKRLKVDEIILDGNVNYLKGTDYQNIVKTVIKADSKYRDVMAASIIAKEYRDNIMKGYSELYPGYGFENHVGYGTKQHIESLKKYGPTKLHRMSYAPIRQLYEY